MKQDLQKRLTLGTSVGVVGDIQVDTGCDIKGSSSEQPPFSLSYINRQSVSLSDSRTWTVFGPSQVHIAEELSVP